MGYRFQPRLNVIGVHLRSPEPMASKTHPTGNGTCSAPRLAASAELTGLISEHLLADG
jgi:hypothetical protein